MRLDELELGPRWAFLRARGWRIRPRRHQLGSAYVDAALRTIWVQPHLFARPGLRIRRFVIHHEIWHALHAESRWSGVEQICEARNLSIEAAREAVANGGMLVDNPSRTMLLWVRASIGWHRSIPGGRYRYTLEDARAPEVRAVVEMLSRLDPSSSSSRA